jgi:predicted small secreted protein
MLIKKTTLSSALIVVTSLLLAGCSGNTTIPDGAEVELASPLGPTFKGPTIVHTDEIERLATIRYGRDLGEGFLIVHDLDNNQSALLKGLPLQLGRLRTADILEGTPEINHRVTPASDAQNLEFEKIYPSIKEQENQ